MLKVFPALLVAAGLAGAVAPSVLAHSHGVRPGEATLAQATTSDTATDLESQPITPDDLQIDDLTDEQVAQLEAIFDTYQPQIDEASTNYQAALENMNNLLVPSTSDEALVNGYNDLAVAQQAKDNLIFQRNLALRSVLTLDQRQAINDYVRAYLGIAPPEPVAVFPMTLVGMEAESAIADLQSDGWVVAFTTPGTIGLDRGDEELNLDINRGGEIIAAELLN